MCADKFRKVAPLNITFSDGEQPTAAKLTAVANQGRNGLGLLEYPIGDPWNQNGDEYLVDTPLQIPNLARLLGENSYLNPVIYPGKDTFKFHDKVGERYANQTTGYLKFVPSTSTVTKDAGGSAFTTKVSNEYDVDAAGEYWFDSSTGRFRTHTIITSSDVVSYSVDPSSWTAGTETIPGVIPDSRQATFTACRIKRNSSTSYSLYLPPRQPLTLTSRETPDRYPSAAEVALNALDTTVTSPPSYWQDDSGSTDALFDPHYRYRLPKDILDVIASKSAGSELPAGMLYLWDQSTETIIDGVVFKRSNASTNLTPTAGDDPYSYEYIIDMDISNSTFDFDAIDTTGETEANYSGTGISLITCGSPLARNIWTIITSFMQHSHNNNGTLEGQVSHNDLLNLNPPDVNYTGNGHDSRYPTDLPVWPPSNWEYDPHTSLLSRGGSPIAADTSDRDIYKNAMLGNLLIANSDSADYIDTNCDDSSFRIYFGDTDGSSIYVNASNGLTLDSIDTLSFDLGGVQKAVMDSSGNVGIGTNVPSEKLDIVGNLEVNGIIYGQRAAGSGDVLYIGNDVILTDINTSNTCGLKGITTAAEAGIQFGSGGAVIYGKDSKIGIGNTTPDTLLHIHNASAGSVSAAANSVLTIENSTTGYLSFLTPNSNSSGLLFGDPENSAIGRLLYDHSSNAMLFHTNTGEHVRINSSGYVGIGNANPSALLTVGDSGASNAIIDLDGDEGQHKKFAFKTTSINRWVLFSNNTAESGSNVGSDFQIDAYADGGGYLSTPFFIERSTGNVGIGTDIPGAKLHIVDGTATGQTADISMDGLVLDSTGHTGITILSSNAADAFYAFGDTDDNYVGSIKYDHNNDKMYFMVNNGTKMTIDSTGNVGIGTATPTNARLEVTGTASLPPLHLTPSAEPSGPAEGDIYVNSTTGLLRVYNGNQFAKIPGVIQLIGDVQDDTSTWSSGVEQILGEDAGSSCSVFIPASALAEARFIEFVAFVDYKVTSGTPARQVKVRFREGTEALTSGLEIIGMGVAASGNDSVMILEGKILIPGNSSSENVSWYSKAENVTGPTLPTYMQSDSNDPWDSNEYGVQAQNIASGVTLSLTAYVTSPGGSDYWRINQWMVRIT